jgi:hypothetical protein
MGIVGRFIVGQIPDAKFSFSELAGDSLHYHGVKSLCHPTIKRLVGIS